MASLLAHKHGDKAGAKYIRFSRNGERPMVDLGPVSDRFANTVKLHVEELLSARAGGMALWFRASRGNCKPSGAKLSGIPDWIRTSNLRLRRPTLYPVELRGRMVELCDGRYGIARLIEQQCRGVAVLVRLNED